MGREVKRVPLGFDWPRGERWHGYLMPDYEACGDCDGGQTYAGWVLQRLAHRLQVAAEDAFLEREPHPWILEMDVDRVSHELVDLVAGLCGKDPDATDLFPFGNAGYGVMKAIVEAAGLDFEVFHRCSACEGTGIAKPEDRVASEEWEPTEPPTGEGWQMWETTTEGSPMSPVFETPEKLARWLADTGASSFGHDGATYEQWLGMIKAGIAPSMVAVDGELMSGVEFASREGDR